MKTITDILNIDSMNQINKDLLENVKQYEGVQDNNNNASPKSVESDCSSNASANGEVRQKRIKQVKHN